MEHQKCNEFISEQPKSPSIDLSQCHCSQPGFCPIFFRRMGTDPPDWKWCQTALPEEKQVFYDIIANGQKTENHKLMSFFRSLDEQKIEKRHYLLYYLTMSEKYHLCEESQNTQTIQNKKNIEYINNQQPTDNSLEDIHILCLGHSKTQFDSIKNRSYISKINLNSIDAGEYSDNKWAEARAFIPKRDLFPASAKFVGFTTASWNLKYEPYTKIDEFHNWETCNILLNSKPEDKIVLCADIFCPCMWFDKKENVLSVFFGKDYKIVSKIFQDIFGYKITYHKKVPVSNQMILHRDNYEKYREYLLYNQIFEKICYFIELSKNYIKNTEEYTYTFNRLHGYFVEMITTFWFYQNDFVYLPNAERKQLWYTRDNIKQRATTW